MSRPDNIFLIGPMGAGKSTIGRHLAELLNKEFRDSDQEIEKRTGAGIPLIFEIEGEAGFRSRESSVLDELTRQSNLVLATGGGVVLSPDNRKILHERGVVVYLHAPLETLLQRTHRDRHRPLLQTADRRRTLEDILKAREPIYRQTADMVIETSHRSPVSVAREIARKLEALQTDENAAS
ncbi:MAG: shikimate kinase I [Candidatus Muproteobacteria bacterium RIFCSPHIGHO2_12_FULL_60_33]|uniref:Shikimate kinase n=1 Tax=Candidatus Muproteobacteria bacterium RIFCSPLOWO2_01_FULL_60_18 TaxID=1817768 RepID=A0A1F6U521_9PROT|nr:MAG: shikimate kinase I [Candidatus Muproteobacteria bacterium RIFCSPHIGHO2_01_60_12]OGI52464.1 MAG: shikimate kinase I [Candidatus Muproteobacteria bacterium RIFCSPLOWO2_01_FULL_60_18]OGI53717.1 MAG: shikimate kinase I [Candidatus Muproteobacteria bacterium RIFCSPHIGHO2_02_FULL_60_13]OGI54401.1 MAG: shikimate kinase I [Candidatus Muproteobacteria bacterium RIFCSPHIGHO2_12_FULL_60_33]OGI57704.1 MAG: shikimate kinase I [Candidatus Muproteobacteria bacterium RIFCSPHIGHO2_01_FULL_61_200]